MGAYNDPLIAYCTFTNPILHSQGGSAAAESHILISHTNIINGLFNIPLEAGTEPVQGRANVFGQTFWQFRHGVPLWTVPNPSSTSGK